MNNFNYTNITDSEEIFYCRCGKIDLPSSSYIRVIYEDTFIDLNLIHQQDVTIQKQETLKTITNFITTNKVANKLILYPNILDNFWELKHSVIMSIYDFNSKKLIASNTFGYFGKSTKILPATNQNIPCIEFNLSEAGFNFNNSAIAIIIDSLCDIGDKPCCDKLPIAINLDNDDICLPLDDFYTEPEINRKTTTTIPPLGVPCHYINSQHIPKEYIPNINNVHYRR